jgi:hypothetical protein
VCIRARAYAYVVYRSPPTERGKLRARKKESACVRERETETEKQREREKERARVRASEERARERARARESECECVRGSAYEYANVVSCSPNRHCNARICVACEDMLA